MYPPIGILVLPLWDSILVRKCFEATRALFRTTDRNQQVLVSYQNLPHTADGVGKNGSTGCFFRSKVDWTTGMGRTDL